MPTNDVLLSEEQRVELSSIAQSRSLPSGYVFRARLILMLAEGASFNTIKRQLRTTAPTISRWKARFLDSGMDGTGYSSPGSIGQRADTGLAGQNSVGLPVRSRGMDRHIGVAANWRRSWVSAKTLCIGPGKRPD